MSKAVRVSTLELFQLQETIKKLTEKCTQVRVVEALTRATLEVQSAISVVATDEARDRYLSAEEAKR